MITKLSFFGLLLTCILLLGNSVFAQVSCGDMEKGSVTYSPGSSIISASMQGALNLLGDRMRANPSCKVVVLGGAGGTKITQQLGWDRVYNVIEYMSDKLNIDRNRFIFQYEGPENGDNITFRGANDGEEGPSSVPPPHPELRR